MIAVSLDKPGSFSLLEIEKPKLKPGFALVKVHRIGVCGTDIHAFGGNQPFFGYPRILGHELGVEVLEVEDNEYGITKGDRCSVEPYMNDLHSPASRRGIGNCCEELKVLGVHMDGGMTSMLLVPINKLHKSEKLSYEQLSLVETLCIGAHGVERAKVGEEDCVLCIGTGAIGLGAIQAAKATGAKVIAMDINQERLDFCRNRIGIEYLINALEDNIMDRLHEICGQDQLPSVVIDATGNERSMKATFDYAGHGGRIVFIGLFKGRMDFDDPNFHKKELTLLASRNALPSTFKNVIEKIENGLIDTDPWITHKVSLESVPDKFDEIKSSPDLLKAIISVDSF